MRRRLVRPRIRRWLPLVALALLAACGGGSSDGGTPITVVPTPKLTTVTVALASATIPTGQTTTANAAGIDQNGAAIAVGTVTWTSSNTSVATVASSGATSATVTAVGPGTTQITATASGGIAGSAALTVTAVVPPPSGNSTPVSLSAAGQSTAFVTSPNINVALSMPAGSAFLIAVVNTDATYTAKEDFTLTGTLGAASASGNVGATRTVTASAPPTITGDLAAGRRRTPTSAQIHLGVLDDNRRIFAARGNPRAAWARVASSRAATSAGRTAPISAGVIAQTIGAVNKVYVKHSLGGSCTAVDSIGARTVAVGQHVIVLADTNLTAWPQTYRPDSGFYQTFANEYDQITYPHLLANIGDPLAYDKSLSGVNKITVTITPVLNNFAGDTTGHTSIVAFVNGCDFFPFAATGAEADRSNETEMFYSWTPSAKGESNVAAWGRELRATAAHESKHIVSYTDRIINDSPVFEEIWLEEGLAQVSSEIWERNFNQATWKGHATFLQTVACEYSFSNVPCNSANDKPLALVTGHLPFFFQYLQTESTSHTEGLGVDTPSNYGAGWTIGRWAIDNYATSEGTFIKSLINEPTLAGLANLSSHTGQSVPLILTYWNLASGIFETPAYTVADPRATFPSFNFADIFRIGQSGLTCSGKQCGIFTVDGSPTPVYPIAPIPLTAGTISNTVTSVPGTSAIFYLLSSSVAGTQTLALATPTGAALTPTSGFRIAILRTK